MKPPVDVAQTVWELERLTDLVAQFEPDTVLEVGIWEGGTLWEWLQVAQTVVAVDDTMRNPGPEEWQRWAEETDAVLHLLHGRSTDADIVDRARAFAPYEFVFIDADHDYNAVRSDYETYGPMVADGGFIAFHDILPRPGYGVDRLWRELKSQPDARTVEIVETGNESANGIGVIWAT